MNVYTQTYYVEREISMPGMEDHDWQEIPLCVEYTRSRYYPSTYFDPAEGGEIEIVSVRTADGDRIELDDAEHDACVQWLHDHHEE